MSVKDFHIGDILSITTGRLVSLNHIGGVYDILNFMTNDDLSIVQLLRAADECRPYLSEMYIQNCQAKKQNKNLLNALKCQRTLKQKI